MARRLARMIWVLVLSWLVVATLAACGDSGPPTTSASQAAAAETTSTPTSTPTATPAPTATPTASPTPAPPTPTSTPTATPTRAAPEGRPIAVVVENELAARPQAGLNEADVLYEAVAEFDLTRFVAVYLDSSAEVVGPVRSGRAYHAAIAAEYQAGWAHCLDVPSVPAVLAATKVLNMDGCRQTNPPGFWREPAKRAPHNLYVGVPALRKAAGGQGTYGALGKRREWPAAGDRVSELSFVYPEDHPIVWRYDQTRGEYLRWQDGGAHVDDKGRQIAASAVVVQQVAIAHARYWGEWGYHELTQVGAGQATLYANGRKREATWRRGSYAEPTRFLDAQGEEIPLPPGKIFFQLVGIGTEVVEKRGQ